MPHDPAAGPLDRDPTPEPGAEAGARETTDTPDAVPARSLALLRGVGQLLLAQPRGLSWILPLTWATTIWWLSSSTRPLGIEGFDGMAFVVNLAHAFEFGVLALLAVPLLPRLPQGTERGVGAPGAWRSARRRVLLGTRQWVGLALVCALLALLDEAHQDRVPGRDASLFDVLTDWVGILCTLRVVRAVQDEPCDAGRLGRLFGLGLLACVAAAGLSTWWGHRAGHGLWFR